MITTSVKRLKEADQSAGQVTSLADTAKSGDHDYQRAAGDHSQKKPSRGANNTNRAVPDHDLFQISRRAGQRIRSTHKWWRSAAVTVPRQSRSDTPHMKSHGAFDATTNARAVAEGNADLLFHVKSAAKTSPIVADIREAIGHIHCFCFLWIGAIVVVYDCF